MEDNIEIEVEDVYRNKFIFWQKYSNYAPIASLRIIFDVQRLNNHKSLKSLSYLYWNFLIYMNYLTKIKITIY